LNRWNSALYAKPARLTRMFSSRPRYLRASKKGRALKKGRAQKKEVVGALVRFRPLSPACCQRRLLACLPASPARPLVVGVARRRRSSASLVRQL
jgi:hypothetical protein